MRDQPFIVSTIRVFLQSRGTHRSGIMATLPVQRDERGVMQSIGGDAPIESFVQIEVEAKESIR